MTDKTISRNAASVERMFEAIRAADLGALAPLLHPDVVCVEPESLPYGGVYEGREAFFGDLLARMAGAYEMGVEDINVIDGGEAVASEMTVVFTSRKRGETIRMPYVEVYSFEDALIRSIHVYPQDAKRLADLMAPDFA